ncbi:MAG TPA: hypothetical protein VKP30_27410 [Polyangiaceae bacterium]|nr:hypothetical protein [Polyangiaceae bacterium]
MVKSSQSDSTMAGTLESSERSRLRQRAGSSVAIASVLISTWTALSCGAKSSQEVTREEQEPTVGGGHGTYASEAGGKGSTSVVTNATGGRSQKPTDSGTSKPMTGGASSTLTNTARSSGGAVAINGGDTTSTSPTIGGNRAISASTPAGGVGGRSSTASAAVAGQAGSADPGSALAARLSLLRSNAVWQPLQSLWREIDAIAPSTSTYVPYAQTVSAEQRDKWLGDLAILLTTVEGLGVLSADEILFLRQVTTARVEVMRDGGYRYEMALHRSPMPFEGEAETSIGRLEQKIDTLLSLRDQCVIEQDAYRMALEQVEREAVTLFALAQLTELNPTNEMRTVASVDLQDTELVTEISRRLEALRATSTAPAMLQKIDAMQARLTTVQGTVTSLHLLVQMLEACG